MLKKLLVVGVILSFIGACFAPSISGNVGIIRNVSKNIREQKSFSDFPPDEEWNVTFGGPVGDWGMSVEQTSDGGYILTGFVDFNYGDDCQVGLIKTDSNGNKQWDKTFGLETHIDSGHSVQQTTDGGYILSGKTESFGSGSYDVWLIKTDVDGNELWNRTFGGSGMDSGNSVQQTADGGYIIVSYTESYDVGGGDAWLIKTDEYGDEVWNKTFGGAKHDRGLSVRQTSDGGYIFTGGTKSFGSGDMWLIKTNSNGDKEWEKTFGGNKGEEGWSVQQTSDERYVVAGYTSSYGAGGRDVWLIKTDADGNELWNKTFGGSDDDEAYSVHQTSDDGYILTGHTFSYAPGYARDLWVIKTNSNGNKQWDKSFGSASGSKDDLGHSVQQTLDGGYIIAGKTTSYGAGDYDIWLIKVAPFENQRPSVEIVNPRAGYFHFSGIPLFPTVLNLLADTASFGGFRLRPIQVNATDADGEPGELMVTLLINDENKGYGIWNPETGYYEWKWTGWALGTYRLNVRAEDVYGGEGWAAMDVWNFCFIP